MYKKLNAVYESINMDELIGSHYSTIGSTVKTFKVKNPKYALSVLESKFFFNIKPNKIIVQEFLHPGTTPHTDQWPTALNIYLNANKFDTTFFYSEPTSFFLSESVSGLNSNTVSKVKTFEESEVKKIGSFIAGPGECYLMNTFIPHGIKMYSNLTRFILRIIWQNDLFEDVKENIIIRG